MNELVQGCAIWLGLLEMMVMWAIAYHRDYL